MWRANGIMGIKCCFLSPRDSVKQGGLLMLRKMSIVVFGICPSLLLTPNFLQSTGYACIRGFIWEGLDGVEAVATGPGTDVTMSGYCCVFGWFLLYLASLASFPKVCDLDMWASLGCPVWQNYLPWTRNAVVCWLSVGLRRVRFQCSFHCARKQQRMQLNTNFS